MHHEQNNNFLGVNLGILVREKRVCERLIKQN